MEIASFNRPTIILMAYVTALIAWIVIRARTAVLEREAFMDAILSTAPNLVRIYDRQEGKDAYHNKDLWENGDVSIYDLLHDVDPEHYHSEGTERQDMVNGAMVENAALIRTGDGRTRRFIDHKMVFKRDPSGRPKQFLHVYTVVSELLSPRRGWNRKSKGYG